MTTHASVGKNVGRQLAAAAMALAALAALSCADEKPIVLANQEPVVTLTLPETARVGEDVALAFTARDVDGTIAALRVEPGDLAIVQLAPDATDARITFTTPGLYTVAVVATDDDGTEGRARMPLVVSPALGEGEGEGEGDIGTEGEGEGDIGTEGEGEGEGDPLVEGESGLFVEAFAIDAVPADWLGNQKAEDLAELLTIPVATFACADGFLALDPATAPLADTLPCASDVTAAENFALRFTGALVPPPGATQVQVEVGADDIGVVFFDGEPVASADEEFATGVFRTDRVPATSEPIAVFGPVELEIVLANGVGAYAWSVRLRFLAADGTVLAENAPASAFVLP